LTYTIYQTNERYKKFSMHVAIIGAGFSGMAVAWYLLNHPNVQVTIFDSAGIGGGASGIAAGLLHMYAGLHSKLNRYGQEGYQAACELLESSAEFSGTNAFTKSGLVRIALTEGSLEDYAACAKAHPDVDWLEPSQLSALIPQAICRPGILIRSALVVETRLYLEGLWKFCSQRKAQLNRTDIESLEELKSYDAIVVACGASTKRIKELSSVPITGIKGQILRMEWPQEIPPLPMPVLNSQAYIIMSRDQKTCLVGTTYERSFSSEKPDEKAAIKEILPKAITLVPGLARGKVLECRAGLRASTPHHIPHMKKVNDRCWILVGMGSKGLLYHAFFAKQLVSEIVKASPHSKI
jgi:glycine/D-amino acid oxidase-like deaminating enzyme